MSAPIPTILALYSASTSLETAHRQLVEDGRADIAAIVHEASEKVLTAVGKVVVAESKQRREVAL